MKPGKHKSSKQGGQDFCCKLQDRAHLLFCAQMLCMNYVIAMFLLVSWMNTRNHPLYFAKFCAGSFLIIANKNIQQRTSPGLITISLMQIGNFHGFTEKLLADLQAEGKGESEEGC